MSERDGLKRPDYFMLFEDADFASSILIDLIADKGFAITSKKANQNSVVTEVYASENARDVWRKITGMQAFAFISQAIHGAVNNPITNFQEALTLHSGQIGLDETFESQLGILYSKTSAMKGVCSPDVFAKRVKVLLNSGEGDMLPSFDRIKKAIGQIVDTELCGV